MYVYEIFFMDTSPTTLLALDSLPDLFIIINRYSRLRIDVWQEINIGPGKCGNTNKWRALNRAWISQEFEVFVMKKQEKIIYPIFDTRFIKPRAF